MSKQDTASLQHWLKTVLVEDGDLLRKLAVAEHRHALIAEETVIGTPEVPVETRLQIYVSGYVMRLLECMRADLPSLHHYLGEELFSVFAKAYLLGQPSGSFSLFELSRGFAGFLERTRPGGGGMDVAINALYDLPAELAKIERGRLEAMRGRGTEDAGPSAPVDLFGFLSGKEQLLRAHPCLQLLHLKMPLKEFYISISRGEQADPPSPAETFLAMSRINYRLQMAELQSWQFHFLTLLQEKDEAQSVHALLEELFKRHGYDKKEVLADASLWIPFAIGSGWIVEAAE
jgi:hypothetical protein